MLPTAGVPRFGGRGGALSTAGARALVFALLFETTGCGVAATPPPAAVEPARPRAATGPPHPSLAALRPLTPEQQAFAREIRGYVETLAGKIGERNAARPWELASASDFIAGELARFGYEVERQGIELDATVAQNLIVQIPGAGRANEIVVLGAHYDSAEAAVGARSAAGVATLLALAHAFAQQRLDRTIRFAFFCNTEAPYSETEQRGARVYAKSLAVKQEDVVLALTLDSLGAFSFRPNSQRELTESGVPFGDTGDFIGFLAGGDAGAWLLTHRTFREAAHLDAAAHVLERRREELGVSDMWPFIEVEYPALSVTDTGPLRALEGQPGGEDWTRLRFDVLARVMLGLEAVVLEVGRARPPATGHSTEKAAGER